MSRNEQFFPEEIKIEIVGTSNRPSFCCGHVKPGQRIFFRADSPGELVFPNESPFVRKNIKLQGKITEHVDVSLVDDGPYIFHFEPDDNKNDPLIQQIFVQEEGEVEPDRIQFQFMKDIQRQENDQWISIMELDYTDATSSHINIRHKFEKSSGFVFERINEAGIWIEEVIPPGETSHALHIPQEAGRDLKRCQLKNLFFKRKGQGGGTEHVVITLDGTGPCRPPRSAGENV